MLMCSWKAKVFDVSTTPTNRQKQLYPNILYTQGHTTKVVLLVMLRTRYPRALVPGLSNGLRRTIRK
jgi:hypothetical protein